MFNQIQFLSLLFLQTVQVIVIAIPNNGGDGGGIDDPITLRPTPFPTASKLNFPPVGLPPFAITPHQFDFPTPKPTFPPLFKPPHIFTAPPFIFSLPPSSPSSSTSAPVVSTSKPTKQPKTPKPTKQPVTNQPTFPQKDTNAPTTTHTKHTHSPAKSPIKKTKKPTKQKTLQPTFPQKETTSPTPKLRHTVHPTVPTTTISPSTTTRTCSDICHESKWSSVLHYPQAPWSTISMEDSQVQQGQTCELERPSQGNTTGFAIDHCALQKFNHCHKTECNCCVTCADICQLSRQGNSTCSNPPSIGIGNDIFNPPAPNDALPNECTADGGKCYRPQWTLNITSTISGEQQPSQQLTTLLNTCGCCSSTSVIGGEYEYES
jgi:hypothetical protein